MPEYKINNLRVVGNNVKDAVRKVFNDASAFAYDDHWVIVNDRGETFIYGVMFPEDEEAQAELDKDKKRDLSHKIVNLRDNYFLKYFRKKPSNKADDGYDIGVLACDFAFYLNNEYKNYIPENIDEAELEDAIKNVVKKLLYHFPAKFLYDEMKRVIDAISWDSWDNYRMFRHNLGVRFCAFLEAYDFGGSEGFDTSFEIVYKFFYKLAKESM